MKSISAEIQRQHLQGMYSRSLGLDFFCDITKDNFHDKLHYLAAFSVYQMNELLGHKSIQPVNQNKGEREMTKNWTPDETISGFIK